MMQVRNVPEDLHRELKVRAASQGLTLSELALNELRQKFAERPLQGYNGETAAESVRAERDSR